MRRFLAIATFALASCATLPADDMATLQADLDAKRAATSATFAAPTDRVFGAVRAILDAISDDYEYSLDDAGRLLVSRRVYYVGGILTTISGRDYWVFEATPEGEQTALTVRGVAVDNTGFFAHPPGQVFVSDIPLSSREGITTNEARMMMGRVAYMLGASEAWPACGDLARMERFEAKLMCSGAGLRESQRPAR